MQRKISFKWFAILLIVPLVLSLMPANTVQAAALNIRYENGILSWNAMYDAAYYRVTAYYMKEYVYANLAERETSTSFNLIDAMNQEKYCPSGEYEIYVKAFRSSGVEITTSNKVTIDYSAVMPRLDTPAPRFNGKTLEWDPIENASKYRIEINVGTSQTSWSTLGNSYKYTTGTSLEIDGIESNLYYQAVVRALPKGDYIWSAEGKTEVVTGEQLINGYASPVVFDGTVTLNITNPKAGDKLHATLSGVPGSIPSSKIKYTWSIEEKAGTGYTASQTVQESTSPDFVVPDNAGWVNLLVQADGYLGSIKKSCQVFINGWYTISNGNKYYYENNVAVTGWKQIYFMSSGRSKLEWFYFNNSGVMQTGRVTIDGKTYLFLGNGVLRTGWVTVGKTKLYCTKEDGLATGWKEIKGSWYYFSDSGAMQNGWVQVSGLWYYLNSEGVMLKEWQKIDGSWYYLGGNGAMRKDWQLINGVWYYLGSNGVMRTGWQQISGVWYYFKSSGAMAANEYCGGYWLNANGSWTYKHKASWRKTNNKWWYGDDTGWYAKNQSLRIDGEIQYFDANGYWIDER